jgi:hypothetical protein
MLRKKLTTNNSNNMKISEIEQVFKDVFEEEEGKVSSVESVYEISKDEKFYKLVISIQNLSTKDTSIIHTKFMFKTDLKKTKIIENDFLYLFDINCVYHKVEFENIVDLKKKIDGELQLLDNLFNASSVQPQERYKLNLQEITKA